MPDWYHTLLWRGYELRRRVFKGYYERKDQRLHETNMMEKFGYVPSVGDWVNDCRGLDVKIHSIDPTDPDTITTMDGHTCSLWHCCSLPKPELRRKENLSIRR